jgi:CTP synthase
MSKYIFVTGGVVSSVGKGITVASIGTILKSRNISVTVLKMDPYLNVDPGTMSPYQHGEVFVTEDGAETVDLGNYERFIDIGLTAKSNITSGQIYSSLIAKERHGDFLGGTIQIVPHLVGEIKERFKQLAEQSQADVIIVEIGGTVGDIEGQPFLEAARQMRNEVGRDNILYVHVTYLPYLNCTRELKTKPTQHSVNELRRIGIQPDVIVCRSDYPIADNIRSKISLFCDVQKEAVIPMQTVDSIYFVPEVLEDEGIGKFLVDKLNLKKDEPDLTQWKIMVQKLKTPRQSVNIALVGKYVELHDAYYSVREALHHAALYYNRDVNILWIPSESLEEGEAEPKLRSAQGIIMPGGFGERGSPGMIKAVKYARENKVPYFGLCLGMQVMVIEYARYIFGTSEPNSTEFNAKTRYPVIDYLPEQRTMRNKGGTMRLGNYDCCLVPGTKAASAYQKDKIVERHRHRYEFNNQFRDKLEESGLVYSGLSPDKQLVEICEVKDHPWMLGSQFHPEFNSRPLRPHPLFLGFINAALNTMREGAQTSLPLS